MLCRVTPAMSPLCAFHPNAGSQNTWVLSGSSKRVNMRSCRGSMPLNRPEACRTLLLRS